MYICVYVCVCVRVYAPTKLPGNDGERFPHCRRRSRRRRSLIRSLRTHTRLEWPPKDTPTAAARDTGAAADASVIIPDIAPRRRRQRDQRCRARDVDDDDDNNIVVVVM